MENPNQTKHAPHLVKGLIAGLIGGLAGTAAKSIAEKFFPPRTHGEPQPPHVLAEKIAGHSLSNADAAATEEAIHWGFGATTGAIYGAIAEFYPAATAKGGVTFGATLTALTHETALPAIGLSAPAEDQTTRERTSEFTSHIVYGIVTETVRSLVRKLL